MNDPRIIAIWIECDDGKPYFGTHGKWRSTLAAAYIFADIQEFEQKFTTGNVFPVSIERARWMDRHSKWLKEVSKDDSLTNV